MRRLACDPLVWITALVAAYAFILAARPSEALFGVPGEWTWSGRPPSPSTYGRWAPAIAALAGTAVCVLAVDRRWTGLRRGARIAALLGLALTIPLVQILLRRIHYPHPVEFYLYRTIGPHNGFWQAAANPRVRGIESLSAYLRDYPAAMREARETYIHLATHPPGAVIYVWLWRQAFSALPGLAHTLAHAFRGYACADLAFVRRPDAEIAAALGQMVVPVWSGLAVVPLYAWARRIGGGRSGWRAASLYALMPTLSLFTMRWDTLYPLFTAGAFALLHRGLSARRRAVWWLLAGATVSVASFFSFGNAILAPATALYAGLGLWLPRRKLGDVLRAWCAWLALLVGGVSVWGLLQLATGTSLWDVMSVTAGIQAELRAAYSYPKWLLYNLVDILVMTGLPITIPFLIEVIGSVRHVARHGGRYGCLAACAGASRILPPSVSGRGGRGKGSGAAGILPAFTIAAAVLALTLSGLSPGEVARLWLHLATGMSVAAALWLHRGPARYRFGWLIGLLAFQSLWLTLFLRVSETGMPSYVPRTDVATGPLTQPALARFEEGLTLVDATIQPPRAAPGAAVAVELTWYAVARTDIPYTVFVHVVDARGSLVAQDDAMPVQNTLPTTCWVPGETVEDVHMVQLPPNAATAAHRILVGWYDLRTRDRLRRLGDGNLDSTVTLPLTLEIVP